MSTSVQMETIEIRPVAGPEQAADGESELGGTDSEYRSGIERFEPTIGSVDAIRRSVSVDGDRPARTTRKATPASGWTGDVSPATEV